MGYNEGTQVAKSDKPLLRRKHFELVANTSAHFDDYVHAMHGQYEEDNVFSVPAARGRSSRDAYGSSDGGDHFFPVK